MTSSDAKLGALVLLLIVLFAYGLAPFVQRLRAASAGERAARTALVADESARLRLLTARREL